MQFGGEGRTSISLVRQSEHPIDVVSLQIASVKKGVSKTMLWLQLGNMPVLM